MKEELTVEEVDYLFHYVQDHNVGYEDVQHELVDHLASAIEEQRVTYPHLTFRQLLDSVIATFPVTGFIYFVQQKEKAMRSYWRTRQWSYMKTYFTLPKVIQTLAFFSFCGPYFIGALRGSRVVST